MKRVITVFFACFLLVCAAVSSASAEQPDTERTASLTLCYGSDGEVFEGLEVKVYRVASVNADGSFDLTGDFAKYPVNIYGITSRAEWLEITSTLESYIFADGIEPDLSAVTDGEGKVSFSEISVGMYLTLSVRVEREEKTVVFESFITVVPNPADDGSLEYDVVAYPKHESFVPDKKEVGYKAVKQWKDTGNTDKRPASVKIDILRDGELVTTEILSGENNWSYRWTAPDDGSVWTVVERDVAGDYTVTVTNDGYTFLVTNTCNYSDERPPQTGDTTLVWPYALGMSLSGGILLVLAVWRKRNAE